MDRTHAEDHTKKANTPAKQKKWASECLWMVPTPNPWATQKD